MKLYICINKQPIKGYTHIDPVPKDDVPAFSGTLESIKDICSQAECEEILAPDMADYINFSQIDNVLDMLCSLLRHNGVIILGGNDSYELSRLVFLDALECEHINNILYGGNFRKNGLFSVDFIEQKLKERGLEILNIKMDAGKFIIKAKRP